MLLAQQQTSWRISCSGNNRDNYDLGHHHRDTGEGGDRKKSEDILTNSSSSNAIIIATGRITCTFDEKTSTKDKHHCHILVFNPLPHLSCSHQGLTSYCHLTSSQLAKPTSVVPDIFRSLQLTRAHRTAACTSYLQALPARLVDDKKGSI